METKTQKFPTPEAVAAEFVKVLREQLPPEDFTAVRFINRDEYPDLDVCASHDFCDANMVMDQACRNLGLSDLMDDEESLQNDELLNLWNKAWEIAKRDHLTAGPDEIQPDEEE